MANFEDFPPIFCPNVDFLPQGGGRFLVKYSPVQYDLNDGICSTHGDEPGTGG